ncbi:MAG TPA: DUF2948 family protein [Rhizobiales bacterium]|nr:DUF2948 family protein [Hyphomicrobiales bacterium]
MEDVKILALEPEDLLVISACMQDAIIRIADISYSARTRQFVLLANRFEVEESGTKTGHRRRTGITFSRVNKVRSHKIRQGADEAVLSLLAIEFEAGDVAPEGMIKLVFSAGGIIELDVECVEVQMEDLGPRWETKNIPAHDEE